MSYYKLEFTSPARDGSPVVVELTGDELNLESMPEADLAILHALVNLAQNRYHAERARRSPLPYPPGF